MTVVVTDSGTPSRLDSAVITINLNDINLVPLISEQLFKTYALSSNGTVVGTVIASDPDPSDSLTYLITAGNTGTAFAINDSSGQLTVNDNTGFTTNPPHVYPLTVQLTDNGSPSLSTTATVTVTVTVTVTHCPIVATSSPVRLIVVTAHCVMSSRRLAQGTQSPLMSGLKGKRFIWQAR